MRERGQHAVNFQCVGRVGPASLPLPSPYSAPPSLPALPPAFHPAPPLYTIFVPFQSTAPSHLLPNTSRRHSPLLAAATAARNAEYCSCVGRPRVRSRRGPPPPPPSPPLLLPLLRPPSLRPSRTSPSPPSPSPPPPPSPTPTFSCSSGGGGGGERGRDSERGDGGGGRGGRGGRGGGGLCRTGDGGLVAAAAAAAAREAPVGAFPVAEADLEEVEAVAASVPASVATVCRRAVDLSSSPWFGASAAERWSASFGATPSSAT